MSNTSLGALAAAVVLVGAGSAAAMPATGVGPVAALGAHSQGLVQTVEFVRRPDGSVYYKRADPNSQGPYLFYYRGYAYPYYPGYAYRAERGELRPSDQPHRVKVRQ